MRHNVYNKDGDIIAVVNSLTYSGEWMGERYIDVSFKSAYDVVFNVGDYIDYRGARYVIREGNSVLKNARKNTVGNAFQYDNIRFDSFVGELGLISCLNCTYTERSGVQGSLMHKFDLYCADVNTLADLINANLKRAQKDGIISNNENWEVDVYNVGRKSNIVLNFDGITLAEACKFAYDKFAVGYYIDATNKKISFGRNTGNRWNDLKYGKDKGLTKIKRTLQSDNIITVLRCMGNSTNMPKNYYYYKELLMYLRGGSMAGISFSRVGYTPCVSFSGKDTSYFQKVFKSKVEHGDAELIFKFADDQTFTASHEEYTIYSVGIRVKWSKDGASVEKTLKSNVYVIHLNNWGTCSLFFPLNEEIENAFNGADTNGITVYIDSGVDKVKMTENKNFICLPNFNYKGWYDAISDGIDITPLRGVQNLQLPNYCASNTNCKIINQDAIDVYGKREGIKVFDNDNEEYVSDIYPQLFETSFLGAAWKKNMLGENVDIDDGLIVDNATEVDEVFYIETPNLNFGNTIDEISDVLISGQNAKLIIQSGSLAGREFEIVEWTVNEDKTYMLKCNRIIDDSMNAYMPNSIDVLDENVTFAITGIYMPDSYIESAAERLEEAATDYLSAHSSKRYTFEPTIDEKWLIEDFEKNNTSSLYYGITEGDTLYLTDNDVIGGSTYKTIDKLSITDKEGKLQVQVTLRDEKKYSQLVYIENKVTVAVAIANEANENVRKAKAISSEADTATLSNYANTAGIANELSDKKQKELDDKYIRKDQDDATTHKLTAEEIEVKNIKVTQKMSVDTLEVAHTEHVAGNLIVSGAKCTISKVVATNSGYKCYFLAKDVDGNQVTNLWKVGDLAYCCTFNATAIKIGEEEVEVQVPVETPEGEEQRYETQKKIQNIYKTENQFYWRLVEEVGTENTEHYILLSNVCAANSDIPREGDYVVLRGHNPTGENDKGRDGTIELNSMTSEYGKAGSDIPSIKIWKGIKDFVMPSKPIFCGSPEEFYVQADKFKLETSDNKQQTITEYIDGLGSSVIVISGDDATLPDASNEVFMNKCKTICGVDTIAKLDGTFYVTTEQRVFLYVHSNHNWDEITDSSLRTLLISFADQKRIIAQITDDFCISEADRTAFMQLSRSLYSEYDAMEEVYQKHTDLESVTSAYEATVEAYGDVALKLEEIDANIPCYFYNGALRGEDDYILSFDRNEFYDSIDNFRHKLVLFNEAIAMSVASNVAESAREEVIQYVSQNIDDILDAGTKNMVEGWIADYVNGRGFATGSSVTATQASITALTDWLGKDTIGSSGLITYLNNTFVGTQSVTFSTDANGKKYVANIDKSGLVTQEGFAAMFANEYDKNDNLVAAAQMGAYIQHVGVSVLPSDIAEATFKDGDYSPTTKKYYYLSVTDADKAKGTYYYIESNATISADYVTIGSGKLGTHVSIEGDTMTLNKIVATNGVFKGKIEANEGFFKGNLDGASGSFSGFIMRKPTTITSENIEEFYNDKWNNGNSIAKVLDLAKCGTYIKFTDLGANVILAFENIKPEVPKSFPSLSKAYTAEYRDYVLQFLGTKIVMYNASDKTIFLYGVNPVNGNKSVTPVPVLAGQVVYLECVFGFETWMNGYAEVIKWNAYIANIRTNNLGINDNIQP